MNPVIVIAGRKRVDHDHHAERAAGEQRADRVPPFLLFHDTIEYGDGKRVLEHRGGRREVEAMLAKVPSSFVLTPGYVHVSRPLGSVRLPAPG